MICVSESNTLSGSTVGLLVIESSFPRIKSSMTSVPKTLNQCSLAIGILPSNSALAFASKNLVVLAA